MTSYVIGERYWLPDEEHAWLAGLLKSNNGNGTLDFSTEKGNKKIRLSDVPGGKLEVCGGHLESPVENLVDLDELSEGAILHHTRQRFVRGQIYTHVGSILVAVNPFQALPIYSEAEIQRAHKGSISGGAPYPHVFVTAATAYQQLMNNRKNQSVLISGESGAGKTETTKKVLTFLASVAPDGHKKPGEPGMETKILQSNPLLEALGNAKTLRNDNSSRFGKWMKVGFDQSGGIQGCEIINYLLEKSRVVVQSPQERNYHIFYQILAGADAAMKQRLRLKNVEDYKYLNQSGCMTIPGVDDAAEFQDVLEAMATLQFPSSTVESIFKLLAGILSLGNVEFVPLPGTEGSRISEGSQETVQWSAELLGLESSLFSYGLTEKTVQMGRGSMVSIKLSPAQAADTRDTLAKSAYSLLFDWIIERVNSTLRFTDSAGNGAQYVIGILDIFGFEVFDVNSFEQLCINYANEKLQYHFNEVIFEEEKNMYSSEGVSLEKIQFEDNGDCVALIEGKPFGLISLLEEECSLGNATDLTYASKLEKAFSAGKPQANRFYVKNKVRPEAFTVLHFAGGVEYTVTNFLDKNRDTLSATLKEVLSASELPLLAELFPPPAPANGAGGNKKSAGASSKATLGGQFRTQLIGLITALKETEPHFIRCVKPNHAKVPIQFDGNLALRQLRYAGLFEAIRIRKSGYSYRVPYRVFVHQYSILVDGLVKQRDQGLVSDVNAAQIILETVTKRGVLEQNSWVVGTATRVFLKTNNDRVKLEREKQTRVGEYVLRIQSFGREVIRRCRNYHAMAAERALLAERRARQRRQQNAAIKIQSAWRRKSVLILMSSMQHLIELRRVLSRRDLPRIRDVIQRLDAEFPHITQASTNGSSLSNLEQMVASLFTRELRVGRVMLRLLEVQEDLLSSIQSAILNHDVTALNSLLAKAARLEMDNHPVVLDAANQLTRLHQKRNVLRLLLDFLNSEDAFHEGIPDLLAEARELGVSEDFIEKVSLVYEHTGPRLRARNRLREAVERLNRQAIESALVEVLTIRSSHAIFGETEVRAARMALRMLHFDALLYPQLYAEEKALEEAMQQRREEWKSRAMEEETSVEDSEATAQDSSEARLFADIPLLYGEPILLAPVPDRLTPLMEEVCESIALAQIPQVAAMHRQRLRDLACGQADRVYAIIRYFKWQRTLCVWRYPEVAGQPSKSIASSARTTSIYPTPSSPTPGFGSSTSRRLFATVDEESSNSQVVTPSATEDTPTDLSEFFGFRFREGRSASHIVRSLHVDFDALTQRANSASMEAALGNVDVPASVRDTMAHLAEISRADSGGNPSAKARRAAGMATLSNTTTVQSPTARSPISRSIKSGTYLGYTSATTTATRARTARKSSLPDVPVRTLDKLPDDSLDKQLAISRQRRNAEMKLVERDLDKFYRSSKLNWR